MGPFYAVDMAQPNELAWKDQFLQSKEALIAAGLNDSDAAALLDKYLQRSSELPLPEILQEGKGQAVLDAQGPGISKRADILELMMQILSPLLARFELKGTEHLKAIMPHFGKRPMVIVSNHLSHFDTALLYALMLNNPEAKPLADGLVFLAGRLVYASDFSRVATHMFDTLLVSSPRDMQGNPELAGFFKKLNLRSFRDSRKLYEKKKILALFPEGTRSRSGQLGTFHEAIFNYLNGSIVLPVALVGSDAILKAETYTFQFASGSMTLCKPWFVGKAEEAADGIETIVPEKGSEGRTAVMQQLAQTIARALPEDMQP